MLLVNRSKKLKLMKHSFPLLLLVIIQISAFAQYDNIDLSKYELPNIKRHQLDFNFESNGSTHNQTLYMNNEGSQKHESESSSFKGVGDLNYSFYRNSSRFQINANCNSNFGYSKTERRNTFSLSEEKSNLNTRFSAEYDVKYFIGNRQWFLTAIPSITLDFDNDKDHIDDVRSKDNYFKGQCGIGAGIGRIEQVQDYKHGILLLQELEKRGVAKRQLSEEEILEFSALLSELKNKRLFDSRKRKQADLEAIHTYLVENGVVNEQLGMSYFLGLEDIWVFGDLQVRGSGKQLKLTVTPGYTHWKGEVDGTESYKLENFKLYSSLTYDMKIPLSLKWQNNNYIGMSYRFTDKLTETNGSIGGAKYYSGFYMASAFGFYPNTRTYFSLSGFLELANSSEKDLLDDERYQGRLQFRTSAYYYISERLRLEGFISYINSVNGVFNGDIENSKYDHFNYNITFSYAIF